MRHNRGQMQIFANTRLAKFDELTNIDDRLPPIKAWNEINGWPKVVRITQSRHLFFRL